MQSLGSTDHEVPFFHPYQALDTNCTEKMEKILKIVTSEVSDVVLIEIGMYTEKLPKDVEEWMKNKLPYEIRLKESSKYMFMREGGAVYTTSPYERCKQMRIKMPSKAEFNTIVGSLVVCYRMRNAKFLTWIFDSKNRTVVRIQSENPTRNVGIKKTFTIHAQQKKTELELVPVNISQDDASSQEDSFDNFCANPTKFIICEKESNKDNSGNDSFDAFCATNSSSALDEDSFDAFQADINPVKAPTSESPNIPDDGDDSFEKFCRFP